MPPRPPPQAPYKTDTNTKLSLSAAISTSINPRGQESEIYPTWAIILREIIEGSNRLFVATEGYLSIPGDAVKDYELDRKQQELDRSKAAIPATPPSHTHATGPRQSSRLETHRKKLRADLVKLQQAEERDLRKERRDHNKQKAEKAAKTAEILQEEPAWVVELSFDNASANDGSAKDNFPDLSVHHVVGGTIRVPTMQEVERLYPGAITNAEKRDELSRLIHQHRIRAGIKIVHKCSVLVGELKPLTHRHEASADIIEADIDGSLNAGDNQLVPIDAMPMRLENARADEVTFILRKAIQQAMYYCAVYFFTHRESEGVIALVGVGPYWDWAVITREVIPVYDWLEGIPSTTDPDNIAKSRVFASQFPSSIVECHILGTGESDDQINQMRDVIAELISDRVHPSYKAFPTTYDFQLLPDAPRV